jgi:hypothetical protein
MLLSTPFRMTALLVRGRRDRPVHKSGKLEAFRLTPIEGRLLDVRCKKGEEEETPLIGGSWGLVEDG